MGDMADWTTDNGLIPEDEWVVSARDNEYEREIRTLRKYIRKLEAQVERLRASSLPDVVPEDVDALKAEVERLRAALEEIVSLGTIESIQQTRIAEGALRGEGEK